MKTKSHHPTQQNIIPKFYQAPPYGMPIYSLMPAQRMQIGREWSVKAVIPTHPQNGEKAQLARKRKSQADEFIFQKYFHSYQKLSSAYHF
jgi:hypothetical protein